MAAGIIGGMSPRKRAAALGGIALAAALALAGCGIDPRVRVDRQTGRDTSSPAPAQTATAHPSDLDGMRVLRDDPRLGSGRTSAIARCEHGRFPVHTEEISLHGGWGSVRLLAVTVYACPGQVCGYEGTRGTYVYHLTGERPGERVYAHEAAGSRVEVRDEALVLVRPEYRPGDAASCPTATRATPLRWGGGALALDGA